ncbi:hypothetical protein UFOVP432_18 [uncultured Caudovirales phage]|uniref:Uncharacterized protein n=1 Tax=uncultured Caudovirales phage TaxID=2100421 RepID=A0A6J5MJ49_9CAUD|nr:hypothetical protein UFOVP432_18 [uncultured Caudovirales phage]
MKHLVSIKEVRQVITDNDLNVTASRSGSGEITVYSHFASDVPALAVMLRNRNIMIDLTKTATGKYVGSICTRYKLEEAK